MGAEVSEARRRGRKGGKKKGGKRRPNAANLAAEEADDIFSSAMSQPGADELIASLTSDAFENMDEFIAEFGDETDDGFRGVGGLSEEGFRAVTMQQIMNAGGPEFCRDMSKIRPQNRPRPGQPGYGKWSEMMGKCAELNSVMEKRKAACHNFLMRVVYNPNRQYDLKPHEQTRFKYCHDITKLKNPWTWCKRTCKKGRKGRFCLTKKNQCKKRLEAWNANKEALKDKANGGKCRPLPQGMKTPPPPNHPLNDKRRCIRVGKKWNCEHIPASDLPWCPFGWKKETADQSMGKGKGAAWGKGKGGNRNKGGKGKKKGGFRGVDMDPSSDKFQEMVADMNNIESQFGHQALNKEINKFQNKKKRGKGRNSYEKAVALSYVDDDVRDRK